MARISLRAESLISQRQEALAVSVKCSSSNTSHQGRKATQEGREQNGRTFIAAQRRKAEKGLRNTAMMEDQIAQKVQKIDSQYYALRQQRLGQINRRIELMQDEERDWKRRRLQATMPGSCSHDNMLAALFLMFLAVTSPFWLCCVFVHKLWVTVCRRFH
jgi:hypothetical protein